MLAFSKPFSKGSQHCGQKYRGSVPLRQVLMLPPRRPWTKIMSTSGSGLECTKRKPSSPRIPSSGSSGLRPAVIRSVPHRRREDRCDFDVCVLDGGGLLPIVSWALLSRREKASLGLSAKELGDDERDPCRMDNREDGSCRVGGALGRPPSSRDVSLGK